MNTFEKLIKDAQVQYEPDSEFVDKTMKRIKDHKPRRRFGLKVWAPALAGGIAAAVFVIVSLPANDTINSTSVNITNDNQKAAKASPSATAAPLEAGTDNASLERALNEIAATASQADAGLSDVDAAFNDASRQVEIPMN